MKKFAIILSVLLMLMLFVSCGTQPVITLGGSTTFYDIEYAIPEYYIFDSTQSKENFALYESGWYEKLLLLSRSDVTYDPARKHLEKYANNMKEKGAEYCEFIDFKGVEAVKAKYTVEDKNCIEVYFILNGSKYAIAMRGETEDNFNIFIGGVVLPETADSSAE